MRAVRDSGALTAGVSVTSEQHDHDNYGERQHQLGHMRSAFASVGATACASIDPSAAC
jgi:hypothetical protein